MALQTNFLKEYVYKCFDNNSEKIETVNYPESYVCIKDITGNKTKVKIFVVFYSDKNKTEVLVTKEYSFTPTMEYNFIKDAYLYLKTLDEFKDAIDC